MANRHAFWLFRVVLAICVIGMTAGAAAQKKYGPGVTDTEIKLGQTMPYSGPASAYAAIGRAESAYFKMINDAGGVNGRKITLISLDDGYSPPKTVEQVRKLVEQEEVLALYGMLGTATNNAVHRYVNTRKVPHLLLATGSSTLVDPANFPWTLVFNPSYSAEGQIYARYLLKNRPGAKIAVLYQNDDFGKDVLKGLKDGLGAAGAKMIIAEASYEVSDPTVDSQVLTLQASGADTFINVATPKFAAQAIRKAYDSGWKPLQIVSNVSTSVSGVLGPAGLDKAVGLMTLGYLKDPNDPQWKDDARMLEWRAFMARYNREADPKDVFNIYGYTSAQVMVQILKQCGNDLTRENVMRQAAGIKALTLPLTVPGIVASTSPSDYRLFKQAQLSRFNGTLWQVFGDLLSVSN